MATTGRETVQQLRDVGTRLGRPPENTPEANPGEESDLFDTPTAVAVVFPGDPAVTARLSADGNDTVVVEDRLDLEVPRRDTVAVVEALLSGRARLRMGQGSALKRIVGTFLGSPMLAELVVTLPDVGRQYSAAVSYVPGAGAWLSALRWEGAEKP